MTALIRNGALAADEFLELADDEPLPPGKPVLVSLSRWRTEREALERHGAKLGVRLRSDEPPELIAEDLASLSLVALEFPKFRDGRAYSYARLLRERYGFTGELRAVGEVLLEQLHFMMRVGFDAFEIQDPDPLGAYRAAADDFTVWYQPTGDARRTARELRGPVRTS